jgi:hypothetical protein
VRERGQDVIALKEDKKSWWGILGTGTCIIHMCIKLQFIILNQHFTANKQRAFYSQITTDN